MGLGDLFRRLSKGSGGDEKASVGVGRAGRTKGGKVLPPIPNYLKKDKFLRDAEAAIAVVTPSAVDEVAETSSFKRPGAWLKSRLGGVSDAKAAKNVEKTTRALKKSGAFNDEEIATFLSGLLDVAVPDEEGPPNPLPPDHA